MRCATPSNHSTSLHGIKTLLHTRIKIANNKNRARLPDPPPPSPKIKQPILEEGEKSHPSLDSMFSESGEGPGVRRSNPNTKPRPPKAFNLQTSAGVRAKHPSSDVYLIDIQAGGWHSDQQGFTCGCFAPTLWLQLLPPLPSAHTSPSPPTSYSARRDTP